MAYTGPYPRGGRVPATGYPYVDDTRRVYHSVGVPSGPLPYYMQKKKCSEFWADVGVSNVGSTFWNRSGAGLQTRAYDSFWKHAQKHAENAVNVIELEKSMLMIARRAKQVADVFRSLRRGDINGVVSALELRSKPPRRFVHPSRLPKKSASNWLEYSFGWKPIISDMATSVEILQREFDVKRVHGRAPPARLDITQIHPVIPAGSYDFWIDQTCTTRFSCSAIVLVTNPNLDLANQLGFLNPGKVLWELVPFSFVIDWFLPVGAFISSFTNDFGVTTLEPASNWSIEATSENVYYYNDYVNGMTQLSQGAATWFEFNRTLSLPPRPDALSRLHIPDPSVWLAVTSCSLMVQQISLFKQGR